jgi:hypothetical protein
MSSNARCTRCRHCRDDGAAWCQVARRHAGGAYRRTCQFFDLPPSVVPAHGYVVQNQYPFPTRTAPRIVGISDPLHHLLPHFMWPFIEPSIH